MKSLKFTHSGDRTWDLVKVRPTQPTLRHRNLLNLGSRDSQADFSSQAEWGSNLGSRDSQADTIYTTPPKPLKPDAFELVSSLNRRFDLVSKIR
ncbi:hypothetical protein DPMN_158372 [Dreissena polymorpha]|uniref:Uncharacterized protein n=1 Tax=Dreissena polymorpha TaxID=45954 RepID=A0A9D4EM69_DREPO|nr:hypothetical protein DPMN_158372 [Dreissena polymorpha]